MKNVITKTSALTKVTARFGLFILFAVLLFAGCNKNPTANLTIQPVAKKSVSPIGNAESFTVLGGTAVTITTSTVNGDVGSPLGAFTITEPTTINGTIHEGDATYLAAYTDFLSVYDAFGKVKCGTTLSGNLAGLTLAPGVYCVAAASTTTDGVLTLVGSSTDTWFFKIGTSGTGALTGTNFTVDMTSGETCNNNVYWWVAEAATMTDSKFLGTILAGAAITVKRGTFSGNAYAKAAVTLTDATVSSCGNVSPPAKLKANEGVGNGVDGNTPGHLHNGGNDDPGYVPGNPGAKNKK